jgi:hypothetical protein
MAVQSTTYGDVELTAHDCDAQLKEIVGRVNQYLYDIGHSWFFHTMNRAYFQKCCRSWVRVVTHLETFLADPRSNYSMLMLVLEHEMTKFHPKSFYAKQLKALEQLLVQGPSFNITTI